MLERKINELRARPKEHRVAVAAGIAIGAGALLFVLWAFFFTTQVLNGGSDTTRTHSGEFQNSFGELYGDVEYRFKELRANIEESLGELQSDVEEGDSSVE